MKEYRTFAEEFILGNNNYTTMEWEAAATEYAALRDQYSLYRTRNRFQNTNHQ